MKRFSSVGVERRRETAGLKKTESDCWLFQRDKSEETEDAPRAAWPLSFGSSVVTGRPPLDGGPGALDAPRTLSL